MLTPSCLRAKPNQREVIPASARRAKPRPGRPPIPLRAASPWWRPDIHADRRPLLLARAAITRAARSYFEGQGFIEVECGALQVSPGNEAHLHAFATERRDEAGRRDRLYLHTSPEFACKKLLAAGERAIFDVARVYRNGERGPLHAPEFTLLEWYRAEAPLAAVMEDAMALARAAAHAGRGVLEHRGRTCDPGLDPERLTVADAFARLAGVALFETFDAAGVDRAALAGQARGAGVRVGEGDTWSDLFSRILVQRVEPFLGLERACLLHDYPIPEAALARRSPKDPRVAERFELYACGVELANGFAELTDPGEQRARFEAEMAEKARLYGERYPIDEDFLEALATMPDACGAALGLDRLVMLACGAAHIDDVIWTPAPPPPILSGPI